MKDNIPTPDDPPWSQSEKTQLAAVILSSCICGSTVISDFEHNPHAVPWSDLALPLGRSLKSCRKVWEQMSNDGAHEQLLKYVHGVGRGCRIDDSATKGIARDDKAAHGYSKIIEADVSEKSVSLNTSKKSPRVPRDVPAIAFGDSSDRVRATDVLRSLSNVDDFWTTPPSDAYFNFGLELLGVNPQHGKLYREAQPRRDMYSLQPVQTAPIFQLSDTSSAAPDLPPLTFGSWLSSSRTEGTCESCLQSDRYCTMREAGMKCYRCYKLGLVCEEAIKKRNRSSYDDEWRTDHVLDTKTFTSISEFSLSGSGLLQLPKLGQEIEIKLEEKAQMKIEKALDDILQGEYHASGEDKKSLQLLVPLIKDEEAWLKQKPALIKSESSDEDFKPISASATLYRPTSTGSEDQRAERSRCSNCQLRIAPLWHDKDDPDFCARCSIKIETQNDARATDLEADIRRGTHRAQLDRKPHSLYGKRLDEDDHCIKNESTNSCDDGSMQSPLAGAESSSPGDSESSVESDVQKLATNKQRVLDRLMNRFHEIYGVQGFVTVCGNSNQTSSYTSNGAEAEEADNRDGKKRTLGRRGAEDDEDDKNNDHSSKRRKVDNEASQKDGAPLRKLACPYYQHDPRKEQVSRSCSGPGWPTAHRIKEHLYRNHAMPLHCRRCYETFETEATLTGHSRGTTTCVVRDVVSLDGFSKEQERQLKDRRSMFRAGNEAGKWRAIYLILFPETPLSKIPSPYYCDIELQTPHTDGESLKPPALRQFEAFMNRELPRKVRMALEIQIEERLGPIEETLKNELEKIVQGCHEALTKAYLDSISCHAQSAGDSIRSETIPEVDPPLRFPFDVPDLALSTAAPVPEVSDPALYPSTTPESSLESWAGPGSNTNQAFLEGPWDEFSILEDAHISLPEYDSQLQMDFTQMTEVPWHCKGKGKSKASNEDVTGVYDILFWEDDV